MKKIRKIVYLAMVIALITSIVPVALAEEITKLNINKATVEELSQLQKVGTIYAQRIIDYREKNGPFSQPEDIMKVKGIGAKIFELNKGKITIE